MNVTAEMWRNDKPGGFGPVPWLKHFREIPEVAFRPTMEDGETGLRGQRLTSYVHARLMEKAWALWVERVNEIRRKLRWDRASRRAIQALLAARKVAQRVSEVVRTQVEIGRENIREGVKVRLNADRSWNLHRAFLNCQAELERQRSHERTSFRTNIMQLPGMNTWRFSEDLHVANVWGSGNSRRVYVDWYQVELWLRARDVDPLGELLTRKGPYIGLMLEEVKETTHAIQRIEVWPGSRMTKTELVDRCGCAYPYFREAQGSVLTIYRQDPDAHRPKRLRDSALKYFYEEHQSCRKGQTDFPEWKNRSDWTRCYLVVDRLAPIVTWEPADARPAFHKLMADFVATSLMSYREGNRVRALVRLRRYLNERYPNDVHFTGQTIPRPHGFRRISTLLRQLEVGPFNAIGLKPRGGECGCAQEGAPGPAFS